MWAKATDVKYTGLAKMIRPPFAFQTSEAGEGAIVSG